MRHGVLGCRQGAILLDVMHVVSLAGIGLEVKRDGIRIALVVRPNRVVQRERGVPLGRSLWLLQGCDPLEIVGNEWESGLVLLLMVRGFEQWHGLLSWGRWYSDCGTCY